MKTARTSVGVLLLSAALAIGVAAAPIASAEDNASAPVEAATGTADLASPDQASSTGLSYEADNGTTVEVPTDPAQGVTTTSSGLSVTFGIPGADDANKAQTSAAGTTTYAADASSPSTSVQVLDDGSLRQLYALADPSASNVISIPVDLPAGLSLAQSPEGDVSVNQVVDGVSVPVGTLDAPWATDANGAAVSTYYTVDGSVLEQHVAASSDSAYPIVADPHYTWGIISGTIYFNKTETRLLAAGGGIVSWIPNPYTVVLGRTMVAWAGIAAATNQCVKLKVGVTKALLYVFPSSISDIGYYSGSSGDGYCR